MVEYKNIKGVNSKPKSYDKKLIEDVKIIEKKLLNEGVEFNGSKEIVPWLVATKSFRLNNELKERITNLGKAVFLYFDAIQELYKCNEYIKELLDLNVLDDLKGLDLEKKIKTFRLDIVVENNIPKILFSSL